MDAHAKQNVELVVATSSDANLIELLLDDYLIELSAHRMIPVGATRAADYRYLDAYWREPGRHAFIIFHDGRQAGFAFVRDPASTGSGVNQLAEFYVKPDCRRLGIGRTAAQAIWKQFPGHWELQVHGGNAGAIRFWEQSATTVATEPLQVTQIQADDGPRCQLNFHVTPSA